MELQIITTFIILCFLLEYFFPRKKQPFFSKERFEDLKWFLFNEIILSLLLAYITLHISNYLGHSISSIQIDLSSLNLGLQFFFLYVSLDFVNYWSHRWLHRYKKLRYIHKIHHSVVELNPLATFRHSLLEQIYFLVTIGITAAIFNTDPNLKIIAILVSSLFDIFQHTNTSFKVPYFLNYIFILPRNHYFHHSKFNYKPFGQNFGLTFSIWDILFKSFYLPKKEDTQIGLRNDNLPTPFTKRILYPIIANDEERKGPIL